MPCFVIPYWKGITPEQVQKAPILRNDDAIWADFICALTEAGDEFDGIIESLGVGAVTSFTTDRVSDDNVDWVTPDEYADAINSLSFALRDCDQRAMDLLKVYEKSEKLRWDASESMLCDLYDLRRFAAYATEQGVETMTIAANWFSTSLEDKWPRLMGKRMDNVWRTWLWREHEVFDLIDWHRSNVDKLSLAPEQAYVHTGLYLAWMHSCDLLDEEFAEHYSKDLRELESRKLTPGQFYQRVGGILKPDFMSEEGFHFTQVCYYDDHYQSDYINLLAGSWDSFYSVKDDWNSFEKMKPMLDGRFQQYNDCYYLLEMLLDAAKSIIGDFAKQGGGTLIPVGAYIDKQGQKAFVVIEPQANQPLDDVSAEVQETLRALTREGSARAVATCADGYLSMGQARSEAVIVRVEHELGQARIFILPYEYQGENVSFGDLSSAEETPVFFSSARAKLSVL
jgi:hypothetical protein